MNKFIFGLVFVLVFSISNVLSDSSNIFEDHSLQIYSPIKAGVKDIIFEIRIDGLVERVKQTTSLTDLDDLYFKFYWIYPGEYRIDVEGLPNGFQALRTSLKDQVKPYLDMIFVEDFIRQFERLPFQKDQLVKNKFNKKSTAIEESQLSVFLSNSNVLESIESSSPKSVVKTKFDYKLRSWSNGKNVLVAITTEEMSAGIKSTKVINIDREIESGVGVPKIITSTETISTKDGKEISRNMLKIKFSNFFINSGKAEKVIKGTM